MSKKIFVAALFLAASVFLFRGADAAAISWKRDLPAALEEAKKAGRPVMADFYADWCGWCKKLDATTYSNPAVQKLAEGFISVKIDGDKNENLTVKYRVTGYPTVIFFDSGGNIVMKYPGYLGPDGFARMMKGVLTKAEKPAGGLTVAGEAAKDKKIKIPSVIGSDFVYNGYVEVAGEGLTAQVNYGGTTYFVQKGDAIKEYKVVSVDKDEVVLEGNGSRLVMEFKKPVRKGKSVPSAAEKKSALSGEKTASTASAIMAPAYEGSVLGSLGILLVILVIAYIYFALCLYFIAKKTQTKNEWLAWVPIAQLFMMCDIGKIRFWWLLLLLVPPVNIFMVFFIWYKVIKARGKPGWLVALLVVPLVNYAVMGYLAFSK